MAGAEVSVLDCDKLSEDASEICNGLLNHCMALHSKIEILRRTIFRLDDLVFSIKSCW